MATSRVMAIGAALGFLAAAGAAPAHAVTSFHYGFGSNSSNTPATGASGTAAFTFTDITVGSIAEISILITNTTNQPGFGTFGAGATDSELVQYAFSLPDLVTYVANSGAPTTGDFEFQTFDEDDISANPFADMDLLYGISSTFNSQGNPDAGIDPGSSVMAGLQVNYAASSATNASDLESLFADFFFDDDVGTNASAKSAMRFKDVNAGSGSDKISDPVPLNVIPLPAGGMLLIGGFAVAAAVRRRRS